MINELLHILNARLRLRLVAVLAVSLLLSACSETPLPDGHDELVELKLRVAPGFDVSTRANSVDVQNGEFDDDTEIGVFILDDDRNEFASAADESFSSHTYLKYENLKYTYKASDGSLTLASGEGVNTMLSERGMTAPMLVKNSRIVVIAYAPYVDDMTYDKLMLTPEPTIRDDQTNEADIKASDFILGTPADRTNSFVFDGKPVSISMRHQLARMVLKFTPADLLKIVNAGKSEAERITPMTASSMTVTALNAPTSTASAINLDEYKENYEFPSGGFTLGEVTMAQYGEVVMSADNENELVATAIVLPYTYAIDKQPQFEIEYTVGGTTKYITLKLRDLSQSITLGRGQSRTFKLKNPDSFTPGSNDENSVLDNLFVDDADGNKVDNNDEVW